MPRRRWKMNNYFSELCQSIIQQIIVNESRNIEAAAGIMADSIKNNGLIHVSGGHCQCYSMEMFYRAGGLVPVNPLLPHIFATAPHTAFASDLIYETEGVGEMIFNDQSVSENDCIVLVSVAGRTIPTIDIALAAKKRGLKIIVLQSLAFSQQTQPKHSSGLFLSDCADVLIDLHVPYGDALISVEGVEEKICPASSVVGFAVIQSLVTETVCLLANQNVEPPVWVSSNLDRGDDINRTYIRSMKSRVSCL
ncbi:sugar isomerase domain-containing protein [Vibrio mimicus]|nr:sugar isomerase domain-containing protein [Vibrio mimicus]